MGYGTGPPEIFKFEMSMRCDTILCIFRSLFFFQVLSRIQDNLFNYGQEPLWLLLRSKYIINADTNPAWERGCEQTGFPVNMVSTILKSP